MIIGFSPDNQSVYGIKDRQKFKMIKISTLEEEEIFDEIIDYV